jgi:hypothetical protein
MCFWARMKTDRVGAWFETKIDRLLALEEIVCLLAVAPLVRSSVFVCVCLCAALYL